MKSKITLNDLPKEKLPEFWDDSARINALYAPFRERSVNPRDWDSKLNFWKNIIETWCDYNHICSFTESELKQKFIQNGRTPACLSVIIQEMYKNGELINVEQFLVSPAKTWSGWAYNLALKPFSWSFNTIKNKIVTPINSETNLIHISSVRKQSEALFLSVPNENRNKIIPLNLLISLCNLQNTDLNTIKLLLHYLKSQNKIDTIQYENNEETNSVLMVKFAQVNEKLEPISNVDMGKYTLEENERNLMKKIEEMEQEKSIALENTKMYLRKGMKQMAKTCLRKEKEIGKRIEKQVSVLENVQSLLVRIGTAETDGKVLESYKNGLNALKGVFHETGLSEDGVADTMADLEDIFETHDDIQTSLSQTLNGTLDSELEEELAKLLSEKSDENTQKPSSPGGVSDEEKIIQPTKKQEEKEEEIYENFNKRLQNLKEPIEDIFGMKKPEDMKKLSEDKSKINETDKSQSNKFGEASGLGKKIAVQERRNEDIDDELMRRLTALKMPPTESPEKDIDNNKEQLGAQ